jgi:lipopolysaccharide export system protein LptA
LNGRIFASLAVVGLLSLSVVPAAAEKTTDSGLLPGGGSKEPISVDADKLVYDDKADTATYSGNVVVIQGTSKLTCSSMTIYFEKAAQATPAAGATPTPNAGDAAGPGALGSASFKRMDATGPVTVVSKTQVATGDSASYDATQRKVWLTGHVTLSDGSNVTKGDKLIYDLATGRATIDAGSTGRVKGSFLPGSGANPAPGDGSAPKK